ncbi:hypothetical protein KC850_03545 [Candidatus Kaiserbacteria bacterium]|nr:hypothetical protein [Candidatus Kaiserbacteria bacterium]
MYPIEALIATGFISFLVGFISHFFFSKNEITLEKQAALVILYIWLTFLMIAYMQDKELSIFFNSAGLGATFTPKIIFF